VHRGRRGRVRLGRGFVCCRGLFGVEGEQTLALDHTPSQQGRRENQDADQP
jgi:hypothetical protein